MTAITIASYDPATAVLDLTLDVAGEVYQDEIRASLDAILDAPPEDCVEITWDLVGASLVCTVDTGL
ncbi:hypothetical protein [Halomicronema sp. CCY15110]|uniref:hypothetical protein n=1 Tax=Halomicronema sp. CCY15110 TaxID=2767773 RepID=UPI0019505ECE|nr:hypothetical protein [Halomicronema sp. CCY15110]